MRIKLSNPKEYTEEIKAFKSAKSSNILFE